jgi:hypothetical protein
MNSENPGLLDGQDSDDEGGEALGYQPEVSNYSFEVSQQLPTHKMKINKKLKVLQALHGSFSQYSRW